MISTLYNLGIHRKNTYKKWYAYANPKQTPKYENITKMSRKKRIHCNVRSSYGASSTMKHEGFQSGILLQVFLIME